MPMPMPMPKPMPMPMPMPKPMPTPVPVLPGCSECGPCPGQYPIGVDMNGNQFCGMPSGLCVPTPCEGKESGVGLSMEYYSDCVCPLGRRGLMVNPNALEACPEGQAYVPEDSIHDCGDGSTIHCLGPNWVCAPAPVPMPRPMPMPMPVPIEQACVCPLGRRELAINTVNLPACPEGQSYVPEQTSYTCADGSTIPCR